jgi:hypothetical protein
VSQGNVANIAGALALRIVWDGRTVTAVDVTSTRPRAAQLLAGKPMTMALALLPMLYGVCGKAQGLAGHAAVSAAQGCADKTWRGERVAVIIEATQEHLWRLLLDWPRLLGLPPLETGFSAWYKRINDIGIAPGVAEAFVGFVEAALLGMPLTDWFAQDAPDELVRNEALAGRLWHALPDEDVAKTGAVGWLANCSAVDYVRADGVRWNEDFARCPEWQGQAAETGALARWKDHPLVAATLARHGRGVRARLLARLMDLAQCTRYIADQDAAFADKLFDACTPAPGVGVSRVETARGALLHRVCLADGEKRRDGGKQMIGEYAVVAPTEWNFQPRGAFVAALHGAMATDAGALRGHGLRLALALDPCVPYEVTVEHA